MNCRYWKTHTCPSDDLVILVYMRWPRLLPPSLRQPDMKLCSAKLVVQNVARGDLTNNCRCSHCREFGRGRCTIYSTTSLPATSLNAKLPHCPPPYRISQPTLNETGYEQIKPPPQRSHNMHSRTVAQSHPIILPYPLKPLPKEQRPEQMHESPPSRPIGP